LERTIADLGAALVVARNKEAAHLKTLQDGGDAEAGSGKELKEKLHRYEDELDTVRAQLETERQRVSVVKGKTHIMLITSRN
jgi:prefoldin subunit 5